MQSIIGISHVCDVQVLLTADPDITPPLDQWDGDGIMSCSIADDASEDVWNIDGVHVGEQHHHTTASAATTVAAQMTINVDAGTYGLTVDDPYLDATTTTIGNGEGSSTTMSIGAYNHWRTMLIEDQPLAGLPGAGVITDEAPYQPFYGVGLSAPIDTVISWSMAPLRWVPDACLVQAPADPAPATPRPIMQDPSIRSGPEGERPEALRQAIAGAMSSAGHPTTPSMVTIGGTDSPEGGLLTFQVRMGQSGQSLPTTDCIARAIDEGQVPDRSVEGAGRLVIGSLHPSRSRSPTRRWC